MSAPTAIVGGIPTTSIDIPVSSIFILLFLALAASHMTLFRLNRSRSHKFIFNALLFGFCMSRIVALIMRIVWATEPTNTSVAIAAQIFINAGILLVYIVNNLLVQRLIRAAWPQLGWNKWFRTGYKVLLWLVAPMIIMVIVTVVQSAKTVDTEAKRADRVVQLVGLTYITVVAVLPLIMLPIAFFAARRTPTIDHFGTGSWNAKVGLLLATTVVACIEAGFRAGTTWEAPRPADNPAWFQSKAAFYCFGFMCDIILAALFLIGRVDLRFHVPDGANGSYEKRREELAERQKNKDAESEEAVDVEKRQQSAVSLYLYN